MKRQRKWYGLVLSAALVMMLVVSACGNNGGNAENNPKDINESSTNSAKTPSEPPKDMKVSASIFDRGRVPTEEGTYEDNRWTKWMNEQSGVDVTWVPILRNQEADKFNVLIASGQAPDMISSYDRNMLARFISQGAAQPIDDIVDKYSTSYKKYIAEHPELKPYVTFNGKMYAVASLRSTRAQTMMWIRQDWLDKLGLKMPTTADELLEVAKAFRDKDPDGNGKKDTVPMAASISYVPIIEDMFFARGWEWFNEGGKLVYGTMLDRYKDVLDYQKKIYDEGLIDKEYLTDTTFAHQQQLWVTGKAGIYFDNVGLTSFNDLKKNVPDAKVEPIPPLATKYGKNGYQAEVPNFLLTIFNKDMKNPQAAMKFIDWMLDKGWEPLTYGVEGVHSKTVNGNHVILDQTKFNTEVSYALEYRLVMQEKLTPESIMAAAGDDPQAKEFAAIRGEALKLSEGTPYRKDTPYRPDFQELTDIDTQMKTKRDEITAKVVIGGSKYTAEQGAADLHKEWDRLGGQTVNQKAAEWYEANKASFQQ
jgi:putative aldouronate transport system substrate-binding protein